MRLPFFNGRLAESSSGTSRGQEELRAGFQANPFRIRRLWGVRAAFCGLPGLVIQSRRDAPPGTWASQRLHALQQVAMFEDQLRRDGPQDKKGSC